MKPRAPRRKVLVGAQIRQSAGWDDVQILDLSARGMQIRATVPPPKGSYVEVRRGHHVIVGRVVWTQGGRAGVATQDPLPVDAIAGDSQRATADGDDPAEPAALSQRQWELRARASERCHERSKWQARAMQVAWLAVMGTAAAVTAFGAVQKALSTPLSHAAAAFVGR